MLLALLLLGSCSLWSTPANAFLEGLPGASKLPDGGHLPPSQTEFRVSYFKPAIEQLDSLEKSPDAKQPVVEPAVRLATVVEPAMRLATSPEAASGSASGIAGSKKSRRRTFVIENANSAEVQQPVDKDRMSDNASGAPKQRGKGHRRTFVIESADAGSTEPPDDRGSPEAVPSSRWADDSFLDEVIRRMSLPGSRSSMPGHVMPVQEKFAAIGAALNVSKPEKVIGEEHPMELGKVKIRPAHVVLSANDTLQLECFVGYNTHASVSWTLNDRVLLEVDEAKVQTIEYKGVKVMVSSIFIRNVLKLPTFKEIYVFKCIYLFDDEMQTAQSVVHARVTDDCQSDHDCAPRNGRCVNARCACTNPQFPVKLQSVHTTCRVEAFLETECLYDEQCESVEPKSECTVHHWCACLHGYARDAWSNCLPKTNAGLRSRCNSDRDCAEHGASCVLSHCSCLGEAEERNGQCVQRSSKGSTPDDPLGRSIVARVSQGKAAPAKSLPPIVTLILTLAPCFLFRLFLAPQLTAEPN